MKIEIKIYKTFDPDLYALSAYGVSIVKLISTALKAYVRGNYVHYHVPRSLNYNFEEKKRSIHLAMEIKDEESVKFLKNEIKPRQRTAFLKALLRGSFTTPILGGFFRSNDTNKLDTKMIKFREVEDLENLHVLNIPQKPTRDYTLIIEDEETVKDKTAKAKEKVFNKTTPKEEKKQETPTKPKDITKEAPKPLPTKQEETEEEKKARLERKYANISNVKPPETKSNFQPHQEEDNEDEYEFEEEDVNLLNGFSELME